MRVRRLASILALAVLTALLSLPATAAQTWRVVRSVRLLTKPSSTTGLRIKTLHPPEIVFATGGKSGDYIRVLDDSDDVGWVYAPYVTEAAEETEIETASPTGGTNATPGGSTSGISASWEKPDPQVSTFHLNGKTCGPTGENGDTETNRRKNRIDVPASYHTVTFEAVDKLPYPDAPTKRSLWTSDQLGTIEPYEGVALTVTGYLVALKPQAGNSESCNCGWTGEDETDWHLALAAQSGEKEKDALVVETTPRIRVNHPGWITANVKPWEKGANPIRVSGWLMMDPQHKNHLGRFRNTLWEIHPITKIEVMQNGSWVNLDALGPS